MNINKLSEYYYYKMEMNVNSICGNTIEQRNRFKAPADKDWELFLDKRIPIDRYENQKWNDATGIGLILGYNDYRALDIDNIDFSDMETHNPYLPVDYQPWDSPNPIIKSLLNDLGLPEDYEWVSYSGSGKGLHIIFRTESPSIADIGFRSKAYCGKFRFELRWRDYLVLPGSIHEDGYRYKFRYDDLPTEKPQYVSLNQIYTFINKNCGHTLAGPGRIDENTLGLSLQRTARKLDGEWSGSTPPSSDKEEFELFQYCTTPEAYNYLGLEYILGRFVKRNAELAKRMLLKSHTENAYINLAQLISEGFIEGTKEEMLEYAKKGVRRSYNYAFDKKYDKKVFRAGNKRYLFFDTETLGLPQDFNEPASNYDNWPRIIQLSWIVTDENGCILSQINKIVYPDGFDIPKGISDLTGITTEQARDEGEHCCNVLEDFSKDLECSNKIIGHNLDYDKSVITAETNRMFYTMGMQCDVDFTDKEEFCTMKRTVDICRIMTPKGYKYPKLQELYAFLFGESFQDAHDAFNDTKALVKCYFELEKRGLTSNSLEQRKKDDTSDNLPF